MSDESKIGDVLKERGSRYGTLLGNGLLAQALKDVVRSNANWESMTADKREAIDNIFQKIARAISGDSWYIDNWLDIEGYARLVREELENRTDIFEKQAEHPSSAEKTETERPATVKGFPDVLYADVVDECGKKYRRCLAIELYDELHEESQYYERLGLGFLHFTPIPNDRAYYPKCKALSLVDYEHAFARSDRANGNSE